VPVWRADADDAPGVQGRPEDRGGADRPGDDRSGHPAHLLQPGRRAADVGSGIRPRWLTDGRLDALAARVARLASATPRPVLAPFTGEPFALLPAFTPDDIARAAAEARQAQASWAATPPAARAAILLRAHDLVLARQDEALDIIQLETGKARRHAFEEIADAANVLRYYGTRAPRWLAPRRARGAVPLLTRTTTERYPYGLAAVVVPWNYPFTLFVTDVAPALAAGNAVLVMPDSQTSYTALWLAALLEDAGVPDGVLRLVTGDGASLGPHVVEQGDVVLFTGSTATGRRVAAQAAARLVPSSLELGGKNPLLVTDDVDLDAVADGIVRGCFVGAGQVCISYERLYIHDRVFAALVPRVVEKTRALRLGCSFEWDVEMGSLGGARQLARVTAHVADAVGKGATALAGGRPRPDLGPFVYEPTLLAEVTPAMALHAAETFGPVAAIYRVRSDDEAIALANDTAYGLTASVWCRDPERALLIARRLDAGAVNVNEAYAAAWGSVDSPSSGWKQSGPGHRHGREALDVVTRTKTIARQRVLPIGPSHGVGAARYARILTRLLKLVRSVPGLR
jgi:succinate-semialdehyde dehydrogenase/glutarate-semialdehyde dehydrogenase